MRPRFVGALIIVVVALVVLPLLFQNPVKYPDVPDFVIPPEPLLPKHAAIDTPKEYTALKKRIGKQSPIGPVDSGNPQRNPTQEKISPASDKKEPFELDQSGLPVAWAVQLATFNKYENAAALRDKLRDAEYSVYTRRINHSTGDKIQILVGPILSEKKVEAVKKELRNRYKLDGLVVRYMK